MTETRQAVKDWWWEGKDLHIITEDDKHTIYTEAVIVSQETILEGSDIISVEPVDIVYRPTE